MWILGKGGGFVNALIEQAISHKLIITYDSSDVVFTASIKIILTIWTDINEIIEHVFEPYAQRKI